MLSLSSMIFAS